MASVLKPSSTQSIGLGGRYLTFRLAGESFGIEVSRTREIIRLTTVTPVPQMPEFVRGVINLRGKIIPVVDLRVKFGLPVAETNERTSIIISQVTGNSGALVWLGFIVDDVEEVMKIPSEDIEEAPDFGMRVDTGYIRGMAKTKDSVKTLLDVDRVVATDFIEKAVRFGGSAT